MTSPSRVGRYEIVRRLSKSMTDVYLAIDTVENRQAALKLVRSAPDAMTQMILEAERRGAAIQKELRTLDPRVVEIYDFGDADGYFFIAMQYVEGRTVAQVLQAERRIDPKRAARVALEISAQLDKFHSWQGNPDGVVVHGDIKPSNVHLGPNDTVRLLDFGIAKLLRAGRDTTLHQFGSPGYCSPERLSRLQVDQQSDLWALGATLYEMLSGAPPYQAEDTRKLEKVIQARRPPRALPADCPAELRAVVAKALAPDPAQRYSSARAFHDDLEAFLEDRPTLAETQRRIRWNSNPTIEVARECLRKVTRTLMWRKKGGRAAEGALWFMLGMALWIGGSAAWQVWGDARQAAPARTAPPAPAPAPAVDTTAVLRAEYVRNANRVIDGYRAASDPYPGHFDWRLAAASLERLVELGAADEEILGKLALAKGYAIVTSLLDGRYADPSALRLRFAAREQFAHAAARLSRSPDPHLALARIYVYSLPDLDRALAEFRAAESLGYRLGPREIEQQADGWRLRAAKRQAEARRTWNRTRAAELRSLARQDAAKARELYARIRGFGKADLHDRQAAGIAARTRYLRPVANRPRPVANRPQVNNLHPGTGETWR